MTSSSTARTLRWLRNGLLLTSALLFLAVAAMAHGDAKTGGSYVGTTEPNGVTFNFLASHSGEKVKGISMLYLPFNCNPGPTQGVTVKFMNAEINKRNRFAAAGKQFDFDGNVVAKATLSGRFVSRKKAKGSLEVHYLDAGQCDNTTTYVAKLVP